MASTIFISKVVQWEQNVHVHIPTFSWETRKNFTYTLILEKFPHFTVDLWTNDCSEILEVIRHFKDLKDAFIKWSCKSEIPCYLTNVKVKIFIYLLQCRICKLQCIGKSESTFKIRLNNDRKNAESEKSILAWKHLNEPNHNFQQHAELTVIKQIRKKQQLKRQENT